MTYWDQHPDALAVVDRLWREGLSATAIAARLRLAWPDDAITRNAVLSKINRTESLRNVRGKASLDRTPKPRRTNNNPLGIGARTAPKPRAAARAPEPKRPYVKVKAAAEETLPYEEPLRLEFLALETGQCKWPLKGTVSVSLYRFCGLPAVEKRHPVTNELVGHRPYCQHHHRLAYQPR